MSACLLGMYKTDLHHRATFRSMLSLAANDEQRDAIEFTDPELETSTVLHQLFDIMLEPEAVRLKHRRIIDRTIRLAQKWDVPSVLRTIRQAIRQDILMETGETLCLFHCAVSMKDYQGIALLLQYRGTYQWGLSTTPEERTQQRDELARLNGDMGAIRNGDKGDTMMNQHLFIPGSMSASRYAEIPPLIHWAIARAVLLAEQESGMKNQWKLVGKHFLQLMLEACEWC